jgi:glycolate oxidase iron-sulfur subunit
MLHAIDPKLHGSLGEPMAKAIETCVHCGFCLPTCPTYEISGQEMDTPRGRIVLMKEILEGQLNLTDATTYLDRCLGCLACETACPSGVAYRELIGPFRAQTANQRRSPLAQRLRRWLIDNTLPYPGRLRLAAQAGRLGKWFHPLVPSFLQPMLRLLPQQLPSRQSWPERVPAVGKRRARVALLIGCAQQTLAPDINTDSIEVLSRNGVEVIVPPAQGCCGALAWHGGDLPSARRFAEQNLAAFPTDVDAVVTNAAGCGSALQEYHLILQGTPLEEEADRFRRRVCDIGVFLEQLGELQPIPEPRHPFTIAYHDACHLAHAQNVRHQPRALLRRIPGVRLVEVPNAQSCCGSAGTYNIDQPRIAAALGANLAGNLIATEADRIVTGNIGCLLQIRMHLAEQAATIPVHHTISLLAQAYRQQL